MTRLVLFELFVTNLLLLEHQQKTVRTHVIVVVVVVVVICLFVCLFVLLIIMRLSC